MTLFYLLCAASGACSLASLWFALWQDAPRFFYTLACSLTLAMLSEMQYRAVYSD